MKHNYLLKISVATLLIMMCNTIGAQNTATINGIKYMLYNGEATVIQQNSSSISGAINIPESVTNNGTTYKVTAFGDKAFYGCDLTSITIPNSVTTLGESCFYGCYGITAINIPSSVTTLGDCCFMVCAKLTSINIPNSITTLTDRCFSNCYSLTSIIIPSSVTTLESGCFTGCTSLTSINIPNSITTLGDCCFMVCAKLTSINLPSSVTTLGSYCFQGCTGLVSINIPSSVTTLGGQCFDGCTGLASINIPSSATTLGAQCFNGCTCLTSINIPSSVTSLGSQCFDGCNYLYNVTCNWTDPKSYTSDVFDSQALPKATLHVPTGTKSKYAALTPWSSFNSIVENSSPSNPTPSCDAPTISYKDGKLDFSCTTTGASYHYTISSPDVTSTSTYTTGEVELSATDIVKVFATTDGYTTSPTTTATIYWLNNGNTSDGIAKTSTRGIMVSTDGGIITIKGLTDGEAVSFYTVSGILLGTAKATNGTASYSTNTSGLVIIAKIGTQSIKVALQ